MIILPKSKVEPVAEDPKNLIIFSKPKTGKSSLGADLPNSLLLDFENGARYYSAARVRIIGINTIKESPEEIENRHSSGEFYLSEVLKQIKKEGKPYKYGIIDTATALEDMCIEVAGKDYQNTTIGKNWGKPGADGKIKEDEKDIRFLPNGAGYGYLRATYLRIIDAIGECFENIILMGHVKDKTITTSTKEVVAMELDLTGKLSSIVSAKSDAIGLLYRTKDNKNILSFKTKDEVICGSRAEHLKNKEIVISELDSEGNLITHWDLIFKQL